jgi:uncharacterized protein YybS (DUF2232 family)
MKKQVRPITEGAMMLAIIGVLLMLNRMTGQTLIGFLVFILPLPSIFYIAKYGFKQGLVLSFAILLFPILIGDFIALFYVATAIVVGLAYGYGVYKDKDNGWLILVTTFFTLISLFIETYLIAALVGQDLIGEFKTMVGILIDNMSAVGAEIPSNFMVLAMSMVPIMLIATSLAQALVTHIIAIILLQRLKIKTRKMKPLSELTIPRGWALLFAVGIFANLGLNMTDNETIQILLTNIYVISSMAFCVDAFVFVLIYAKTSGKRFLSFIAILVFFIPTLGTVIGLFDSFTDIRKRVLYNYAKSLR